VNRERILKRLEEIERRVTKTTPGPWRLAGHIVEPLGSSQVIRCGDRIDVWNDESYANAEFIAHSREDMLWLRQLVRRLLAVAEAAKRLGIHYSEGDPPYLVLHCHPDGSATCWQGAKGAFKDHAVAKEVITVLEEALAALEEVE